MNFTYLILKYYFGSNIVYTFENNYLYTMKRTLYLLLFILFIAPLYTNSQEKQYKIRTIAFYNVENLFDTINDPNKNDEASPMMELKNNRSKVYNEKINNMAMVISKIGLDKTGTTPAIIGLAEVENRKVLEDLVATDALKNKHYNIIHYDSPDKRGIDVALLYQKRYFKPIHQKNYELRIWDEKGRRIYTRDQLLVSGILDDELIHVIVNHWPSRSGGEAKSRSKREKAAWLTTQIIKDVKKEDPNAKIIIMGDLNDDPTNSSLKKVLKAKGKKNEVKEGDIYNPMENMFRRGFNTLGYRDNINLFDQILISSSLLNTSNKYDSYKMYKTNIFNPRFLTNKKGRYKGYPFRSFSNGSFTGGYSDHFPVYMYLIKEK